MGAGEVDEEPGHDDEPYQGGRRRDPMIRNSWTPKPSNIGLRTTSDGRDAHDGFVAGQASACNNNRAATTARVLTGRIVGLRALPVKTPCSLGQDFAPSW